MKLKCNFGDQLNHCNNIGQLSHADKVPVFDNLQKLIGEASIYKEDNKIIADIVIDKTLQNDLDKIRNMFEFGVSSVSSKQIEGDDINKYKIFNCAVGGLVTKQTDNLIEEFEIKEVSIIFNDAYESKPKNIKNENL
jgi:hypothetical protein